MKDKKVKKQTKLKIMTAERRREVKRGSLEPMEIESPWSSTARRSSKRDLQQVEPDLEADEE